MKRKLSKLLSVMLVMCMTLSAPLSAKAQNGDVVGYTRYTDIAAYINHFAIQSYNYNDTTYIVAEDLRDFGFRVEWNGDDRTLNITRDSAVNSINQQSIPRAVSADMVGQYATPILETDIQTFINGELADSGNIDGKTVIPFKALGQFGAVEYDDSIRAAKLWVSDGLQVNSTMQSLLPYGTNPYNEMGYIDVTGVTIAEIAESNGMELSEFLALYGLPADMPGDTNETAAIYMIPVSSFAQMNGLTFEELKEELGLGDDIAEDTPWGVAEGELPLSMYVGEESFDAFKTKYGFGDDITLETKWKDVRNTIDAASKKERYAYMYDEIDDDDVDAEPDKSDAVHIRITLSNNRKIEADLYPHVAPESVENFVNLIKSGFFDGLIFHRVIDGFMIQGGGYDESFYKGNFTSKEADTIVGEFRSNGFTNSLKHTRGVISMARTSDPNSASSQFFIMHQDAPHLDGEYAAFGEVTSGMDVVDEIAGCKTTTLEGKALYMGNSYTQQADDVPEKPIVIRTIRVIQK